MSEDAISVEAFAQQHGLSSSDLHALAMLVEVRGQPLPATYKGGSMLRALAIRMQAVERRLEDVERRTRALQASETPSP